MGKSAKLVGRMLTDKLRELMASVHTVRDAVDADGEIEMVTRAERLAELLCDRALGWEEEVIKKTDVPGQVEESIVKHKPERWAMELVWERLEGRAPTQVMDDSQTMSATDRVSELATDRINELTKQETKEHDDGVSSE